MDHRRPTNTNPSSSSTPPLIDKDVAMGPPPPPAPASSSSHRKELAEVVQKYNRLKRRFADLEEVSSHDPLFLLHSDPFFLRFRQKHRETSSELQRSGMRNVKMREEREYVSLVHFPVNPFRRTCPSFRILLDRIIELESLVGHGGAPNPSDPYSLPSPSALPRSLASSRAQSSFVSNLRAATAGSQSEDVDTDPIFTSPHLGPLARQRAEEERREEEARETKRSTRRTRQSNSRDIHISTASSHSPAVSFPPSHSGADTPPTLVSSGGMRLRIRPPAPPISEPGPSNVSPNGASASSSSSRGPSHPPSVSIDGRSQSPSSPSRASPKEEHGSSQYNPQLGQPLPSNNNNNYAPSPYYRDHGASSGSSAQPTSPVGYRGGGAKSGNQGSVTTSPTSHAARTAPPHTLSPPLSQSPSMSGQGNGSSPSRPSEIQRHAKPKRLKAHTVTTKSYSIPMVPRDKNGKPMLPLNVGIMTVISLGDVCMREHFHTERYIFPVGYEVTR
jgi:hypothetical protein